MQNLMGKTNAAECEVCHAPERIDGNTVTPGVYIRGKFYCAQDAPTFSAKPPAPPADVADIAVTPAERKPPVKPPVKPKKPKP